MHQPPALRRHTSHHNAHVQVAASCARGALAALAVCRTLGGGGREVPLRPRNCQGGPEETSRVSEISARPDSARKYCCQHLRTHDRWVTDVLLGCLRISVSLTLQQQLLLTNLIGVAELRLGDVVR
jgi:hypothetical protein